MIHALHESRLTLHESRPCMREPWHTLSIRCAIGIAFTWFASRNAGAIGLAFSAPVWGLLLARPLFELFEALHQRIKQSAWDEPGIERHGFGGYPLRVKHVAGYPWIVDVDLLYVLGERPSKQSRRRAHPARYAPLTDSRVWGYSEDGALSLLAASRHPDAHKLKLYLERRCSSRRAKNAKRLRRVIRDFVELKLNEPN